MKKVYRLKLMTGGYTLVDYSDWLVYKNYKWTIRSGYAGHVYHVKGKQYTVLLHRLIMNANKTQIIDHKNQNKLDNRRSNLRFTNRSKNAANCKIHNHNTSGYKGVSKCGKKWRAYIVKYDKQIHIGVFKTKKEAALAYNKKALQLFKSHVSLNKVR